MQLLSGLLVLEDCSDKYRNNDDDGNDDFGCLLRMALPAVLRRESSAGIDLHDCRRIGPPRLLSIIIMAMTMIIIIIIMLMMNKMMEMVSVDIDLPNCWGGFDHPVWWLTDHDDDDHEDYDDENNHVVNRWWFPQVPEDGTTPSESKF